MHVSIYKIFKALIIIIIMMDNIYMRFLIKKKIWKNKHLAGLKNNLHKRKFTF